MSSRAKLGHVMVGLIIVEILLVGYMGLVGIVTWNRLDPRKRVVPIRVRTDRRRN